MTNTGIKIQPQIGLSKLASSLTLITVCCLALFYLDKETKSLIDLFKLGNLAALSLYVLPIFFICALLQRLFLTLNCQKYFLLAHVMGIPIGVAIVMVILAARMGWF